MSTLGNVCPGGSLRIMVAYDFYIIDLIKERCIWGLFQLRNRYDFRKTNGSATIGQNHASKKINQTSFRTEPGPTPTSGLTPTLDPTPTINSTVIEAMITQWVADALSIYEANLNNASMKSGYGSGIYSNNRVVKGRVSIKNSWNGNLGPSTTI